MGVRVSHEIAGRIVSERDYGVSLATDVNYQQSGYVDNT